MNGDYYATMVTEPISPGPINGDSPPGYIVGSLEEQESNTYYDATYQTEIPLMVQHTELSENQAYTQEASPTSDENTDCFSQTLQNTEDIQIWSPQTEGSSCEMTLKTAKNPSYEQLCSELLDDDNTWNGDYMEVFIKQEVSPASYQTSPVSNETLDIGFEGCGYQDITNDPTQQAIVPVSVQTIPVPNETPDSGFGGCDDYDQQECSQVPEESFPITNEIPDLDFGGYGEELNGSNNQNHQDLSSMKVRCKINEQILPEYQAIKQERKRQYSENSYVQKPVPIDGNGYPTMTNAISRVSNFYQQFPVNHGRGYNPSYHTTHPVIRNHIPPYLGMPPQHSQIQNEFNYTTVAENHSFGQASATVDAKRFRTAFTDIQLKRLEEEFSKNQYTDRQKRIQLSMEINLTEKNIKIWYQNRRMKFKKEKAKQSDHLEIPTKTRRRAKCHSEGKYVANVAETVYPSANQVVPNMQFPSNRQYGNGYYVPAMNKMSYYGPQSQQPYPFTTPNLPFGHMCNCSNMHSQVKIPNHFVNYTNNVSPSNRFVNM